MEEGAVMRRVKVARSKQVREGELLEVKAKGTSVLLTRVNGEVHAVENRCPHLGLSMSRGRVEDGVLRCPWHGSTFDVCSGRNLDWITGVLGVPVPRWTQRLIALGQAPTPVRTFPVEQQGSSLFVLLDAEPSRSKAKTAGQSGRGKAQRKPRASSGRK
jgi:nitrite reductase/ring-hydroxylating ferredoxin subunit